MNPITTNFAYTSTVQTYNVTVTGTYSITAFGAQGGSNGAAVLGSFGAETGATFNLNANDQLRIVVGGQGINGNGGNGSTTGGGGGGGTFVERSTDGGQTYSLLLASGGGGGASFAQTGAGGSSVTSGRGNGLGGAGSTNNSSGGGGGAGYLGGGTNASDAGGGGAGGFGATSYTSFGAGNSASTPGGAGGFGGGGGGGFNGGGGGGGYTGGNGALGANSGGSSTGGTSFLATFGTQTLAAGSFNPGNGSVLITAPTQPVQPAAPCYVTGTRIRVLRGRTVADVPVERLAVGDLAITASGKPRSIRWIGTRAYPGITAPKHDRPVRIRAGAFAENMPARDLLVSPDHCLWLDGLFVAAGHLVNGKTITRGEAAADLTYWHVELDSHDLLLAENTPAESFLAAPGVRAGFDGTVVPDAAIAPVAYAPRAERHTPEMDALRERLILRAGLSVEPTRFGAVRAWLDVCDGARVAGWVRDEAHPDAPVCLDIVVDGAVVALALAQDHRADLAAAGMGDGRHGFDIDLDAPLTPGIAHTVEVRRSADGLRVAAMAVDAAGAWTALLAA